MNPWEVGDSLGLMGFMTIPAVPTADGAAEGGARADGPEGPRGGRRCTSRGSAKARDGAHGPWLRATYPAMQLNKFMAKFGKFAVYLAVFVRTINTLYSSTAVLYHWIDFITYEQRNSFAKVFCVSVDLARF